MLPRAALKAAHGRGAPSALRIPTASRYGVALNTSRLCGSSQRSQSRHIRTLAHPQSIVPQFSPFSLTPPSLQYLRFASNQSGKPIREEGRPSTQGSVSKEDVDSTQIGGARSPAPSAEAAGDVQPEDIDIAELREAGVQCTADLENRRTLLVDLQKVGEEAKLKGDKERENEVEFLSEDIRRQVDELQQKLVQIGELERIAQTAVEPPEDSTTSKLRAENDDAPELSGSLPDLRQGIPSTFHKETSDTSSFKSTDSQPPALNLTEDPSAGGGRREGDSPREHYVSSSDRRREAFARWMYVAAGSFGIAAFAYLGRDWENEAETNSHPDAPNGLSPMSWYSRFRERLGGQFSHYTEPAFPKLLPEPPVDQRMPYTLVLSLEDLLVTSSWTRQDGYRIAKRPGVDYFLRYLCQYYELVIFTTVQAANGDLVLRQLDPFSLCLPLFRDGTRYMNGEHVKDLTYLNRDLSKTLIIDTNPAHTQLQPENAIILPKWQGSKTDPHTGDLVALIPFLEYIAGMELSDVRKVLASYAGTHIPTEFHRREQKARDEFNKRRGADLDRRGRLPGAGMLGSLAGGLGFKAQPLMGVPGEQTPQEAFAQGKMLSDQLRERGLRGYQELEKQILENGEMWLKLRADEEKKAQEEGMRNLTGGMMSGFFGGGGGGGGGGQQLSASEVEKR